MSGDAGCLMPCLAGREGHNEGKSWREEMVKAVLEGTISITSLPPHRGIIVNLCFFAVPEPDAPVPFNGDPPAEAATDCEKVLEQVDLETESQVATREFPCRVERPPGYYFVQVRVILFRMKAGKVFAQAEQFFFARRPVQISAESASTVTLPVSWPVEPLEELHHYGTIKPQAKRPWWRFW
jgi:hypothetical protein